MERDFVVDTIESETPAKNAEVAESVNTIDNDTDAKNARNPNPTR